MTPIFNAVIHVRVAKLQEGFYNKTCQMYLKAHHTCFCEWIFRPVYTRNKPKSTLRILDRGFYVSGALAWIYCGLYNVCVCPNSCDSQTYTHIHWHGRLNLELPYMAAFPPQWSFSAAVDYERSLTSSCLLLVIFFFLASVDCFGKIVNSQTCLITW